MVLAAPASNDRPRVKSFSLLGLLTATFLLTACGETQPLLRVDSILSGRSVISVTQRNDASTRETLKSIAAMQERLDHIAAPLLIKNQDLCRKLAQPLLGFTAKNKYSYSAGLSAAAQQALGLGELLQVTGVMAGSGAARSGLQRGDVLVSAGGKQMPQGPNAEYDAPEILAPLLIGQPSIKLTVLRNGKSKAVSVPLTRACGFRVELGNADNVNSYADGRRIMVTRGMMNFVRSDEELAYVIAKEMAHNALMQPRKLGSAAAARDLINSLMPVYPYSGSEDKTSSIKPMPSQMDALADRLSLYMLTRGAHSINGTIAFWQRLAQQVPESVQNGHTALHPATADRVAAMEKTIADIKARRRGKK